MAASSTPSAVSFPPRFYLRASNNKFVTRADSLWRDQYFADCISDSAEAPQNIFEVVSSHPDSDNKSVVLKHVETGKRLSAVDGVLTILGNVSEETYFRLDALDVKLKDSRAAIFSTSSRHADHLSGFLTFTEVGVSGVQQVHVQQGLFLRSASWRPWLAQQGLLPGSSHTVGRPFPPPSPDGPDPFPGSVVFTVYDSALDKVWREVVYDFDKAELQDVQPFTASEHTFDNSRFDQTVIFKPSLSYSLTIDSNWSSSSSFGFSQSISMTARIPFVKEVEVGVTAEQSFETTEGGGYQISQEDAVEVEVPVPPFRKVQVSVVGVTGKVNIPFRHREISTYADGTVRERILYDGVCESVSSTGTTWRAQYVDDAASRGVEPGDDTGLVVASGELPQLL